MTFKPATKDDLKTVIDWISDANACYYWKEMQQAIDSTPCCDAPGSTEFFTWLAAAGLDAIQRHCETTVPLRRRLLGPIVPSRFRPAARAAYYRVFRDL